MTELSLHGRKVATVFDLVGKNENAITASVGWGLAQSDSFRTSLLRTLFPHKKFSAIDTVLLQSHNKMQGITDIELDANGLHLIIEAKRGWNLPSLKQLQKYAQRLQTDKGQRAIVVFAECSPEYAQQHLPNVLMRVPILYASWKQVAQVAKQSRKNTPLHERYLLKELYSYLREVMEMRDKESNLVYVLALAKGHAKWSSLSWIDFVEKRRLYFHPFGINGWPSAPPNYIAFRYNGKLQHIHHVESYKVTEDLPKEIAEIDGKKFRALKWGPFLLYKLGPPMIPQNTVKSGGIYANARLWAALDLLLTCSTIKEAVDMTKKRKKKD